MVCYASVTAAWIGQECLLLSRSCCRHAAGSSLSFKRVSLSHEGQRSTSQKSPRHFVADAGSMARCLRSRCMSMYLWGTDNQSALELAAGALTPPHRSERKLLPHKSQRHWNCDCGFFFNSCVASRSWSACRGQVDDISAPYELARGISMSRTAFRASLALGRSHNSGGWSG